MNFYEMERCILLMLKRKRVVAFVAILYVLMITFVTKHFFSDHETNPLSLASKISNERENSSRDQNHNNDLLITCGDLHLVKLGHKINHGTTKQVFSARFTDGITSREIIIKMVTLQSPDVSNCIETVRSNSIKYYHQDGNVKVPKVILYGNPRCHQRSGYDSFYPSLLEPKSNSLIPETECFMISNRKLMKEILLSMQLNHPGLIKFLGYCARGDGDFSISLSGHSLISAYEIGLPFHIDDHVTSLNTPQKLNTAWVLADLLEYLHLSPLGSLRISDLKESHFVMSLSDYDRQIVLPFNNSYTRMIRMLDLDDLEGVEPRCFDPSNHPTRQGAHEDMFGSERCGYNLPCIDGYCRGFNQLFNMDKMNQLFFQKLFQNSEGIANHEDFTTKAGLHVTQSNNFVKKVDGKKAQQLPKKLTFNSINFKSAVTEYLYLKEKIREKLDKIEFSPSSLKNEIVELCNLFRILK